MKKISMILAFLVGGFVFAQEKELNAHQKDALKYVKINADGTFEASMKQVFQMIPAEKRDEFKKEVYEVMNEMYVDMAIMYAEEFTHNEIKEILAFYETPVGKKIQETMPELTDRAMDESQKLQYKLMPIMQKYMTE